MALWSRYGILKPVWNATIEEPGRREQPLITNLRDNSFGSGWVLDVQGE
jgi:hypothetical protein